MLKKYEYLDKITEYIEHDIQEEINLEEVAKAGAVSLMQLYRDFYAYTGHSLKEYIRKRRLSNACAMIKHTDTSLVEIALLNGYETQQSFHKHFKNVLGITPLEYKNGDIYFCFYPLSPENISVPIKVGMETLPVTISCKYYASQQKGIENKAVSELLAIMKAGTEALCSEKLRLFGRDGKQRGNRFCYELLIAPSGNMEDWLAALGKSLFSEVSVASQTTGFYASCTVKNIEQDIVDGWNYLYNIWLNGSMFILDDREYFEEYCFKGLMPYNLKLFLPVKKKLNYATITLEEAPEMTFLISKKSGLNAEEAASKRVMKFLIENYPHIVKEAATFYVSCYNDTYECGVMLDNEISSKETCEVEIIKYAKGTYAKIIDSCCGDISIHAALLKHWLVQNGLSQDGQRIFAIYEASDGSFEASDIKMTVLAPVKMLKTDNTMRMDPGTMKEKTGRV
jgi:AraC family transcriptional regulator